MTPLPPTEMLGLSQPAIFQGKGIWQWPGNVALFYLIRRPGGERVGPFGAGAELVPCCHWPGTAKSDAERA